MSKSLIELSPTEQFLADQGITMTLKDIADKYGKRHSDLKATFNLAISKLSEENIGYVTVVPKKIQRETGKGKIETINTFTLDLRTMLWLMTKFDENMRMNVINFAFEKLEKEKKEAVKESRKPIMYDDGHATVRRCIMESFQNEDAPKESDIWTALVWKGFVRTEAKVTVKRVIPDELDGFVGKMKWNTPSFLPETIEKVYKEWVENKKPIKSEYERLVDEFEQISRYYKEKIEEAKRNQCDI
jgi:hypothetical protein